MNNLESYLEWLAIAKWSLVALGLFSCFILLGKKQIDFPNRNNSIGAIVLALLLIAFIGLFPIPYNTYSDRDSYANKFEEIMKYPLFSDAGTDRNDPFFYMLVSVLTRFATVEQVFIIIAAIYIGNYFFGIRRIVGSNSYWLMVGAALSMAFVSYGINTLRAGLALSFVFLGIVNSNHLRKMTVFFILALGIHFSTIIPIGMVVMNRFYDRTRIFFILWVISIPLSFFAGEMFNTLFSGLSSDTRTEYLTAQDGNYNVGFRVDFIVYSLVPMVVGAYYIFKKKYTSAFYKLLYNTYVLSNIFWILVIRADFSDRFAYLSWFLIPFILMCPILAKPNIVKKPVLWIAVIIMGETLFKIIM